MLRQKKHLKFSRKFDPSPFKVTHKKGTMITALRSGKYVTHNTSLFKRINGRPFQWEDDSDDNDSADHDNDNSASKCAQNSDDREDSTRRYPMRVRKPVHQYGQNVYDGQL